MFGFRTHMDAPMDGQDPGGGGGGVSQSDILSNWNLWVEAGGDPVKFLELLRQRNQQQQLAPVQDIFNALPVNLQQNGIQTDEFHWVDPSTGNVYVLDQKDGKPTWSPLSDGDSKRYLASIGVSNVGQPTDGGGGGGGGGSAGMDPQALKLAYDRLYADYVNMGLDAESARRQALTTLITNRNNTASDTAQISANVAKTAAEFAANPRDAFAELFYRNQVGGSTPFGDLTNNNFGEYGKALAEKNASIFQPVSQDLQQLRTYRDSIPPVEFFGPETRSQLGLAPTPAQSLIGGGTAAPPAGGTAPANPAEGLQLLMDQLNAMSPEQQYQFRQFTDPAFREANPNPYVPPSPAYTTPPVRAAMGGTFNFDSLYDGREKPGESPSSSEGGLNMNLHERALIVGESGRVYATLGERRPDGSIRSEQLQIKPLKSEVEKDKKMAEGNKAVVESQKKTLAAFAGGGNVNATPDDLMEQLSQYLGSLGSQGGGTGSFTSPLPSPRLLAGDPWNRLLEDPVAMDYANAGFSALGIDPRTVQATVKKFTPTGIINNLPRVNFA